MSEASPEAVLGKLSHVARCELFNFLLNLPPLREDSPTLAELVELGLLRRIDAAGLFGADPVAYSPAQNRAIYVLTARGLQAASLVSCAEAAYPDLGKLLPLPDHSARSGERETALGLMVAVTRLAAAVDHPEVLEEPVVVDAYRHACSVLRRELQVGFPLSCPFCGSQQISTFETSWRCLNCGFSRTLGDIPSLQVFPTLRPACPSACPARSWRELDALCKTATGQSAKMVALSLLAEELDPDETAEYDEEARRLADIIGSSGDTNSRSAAAGILRRLRTSSAVPSGHKEPSSG